MDRFPENFMFQLSDIEFANLKSQTVISNWGGIRKSPYVFTEMGIAMLSAILRTETAVRVSIQIKKSIVLIDNYVDDTVLRLFTKRNKSVSLLIYTKTISPQLSLDLQKHNAQYTPIIIKAFNHAHDRFLIVDEETVYHIGASLKDLGKKWFAFSKMKIGALDMLNKLRK